MHRPARLEAALDVCQLRGTAAVAVAGVVVAAAAAAGAHHAGGGGGGVAQLGLGPAPAAAPPTGAGVGGGGGGVEAGAQLVVLAVHRRSVPRLLRALALRSLHLLHEGLLGRLLLQVPGVGEHLAAGAVLALR